MQTGTRFLTQIELRYPIINLELLAVTWDKLKVPTFLAGLQLIQIFIDHHHLTNNLQLDEIRLQHLCTTLMTYCITLQQRDA